MIFSVPMCWVSCKWKIDLKISYVIGATNPIEIKKTELLEKIAINVNTNIQQYWQLAGLCIMKSEHFWKNNLSWWLHTSPLKLLWIQLSICQEAILFLHERDLLPSLMHCKLFQPILNNYDITENKRSIHVKLLYYDLLPILIKNSFTRNLIFQICRSGITGWWSVSFWKW